MVNQEQGKVTTDSLMDRSFVRVLVAAGIIAVLFYIAVRSFLGIINEVEEFKYDLLAERFSISMDYARREWIIRGKPDSLTLEYYIDQQAINNKINKKLLLQINEFGWPINVASESRELDCLNLWMYFAHEEQDNKTVENLTEQLDVKRINNNCHYLHKEKFPNQLMFSYNSSNGQVVTSNTY
ncbi:hypothetical protein RT723_12025 [Psychrosphaera aquimarina]|uniref:Uncharacterized protein n=1 Tax=Psychrosphaera aquimarina TaxID=2044854 RepID=A0ABU3R210_9GAMM|nr:hypothetical protein [Psychrosphaera aquimarina]MDU0113683.1 hypothetical protein [Psychrosphaera aquimarina]MDU0113710.1 hypothetical protein [Psychrosphaera aquimarina]